MNDDSRLSKAESGDGICLLVASFILLLWGMCIVLFTCCVRRKEKKRAGVVGKEVGMNTVTRRKQAIWMLSVFTPGMRGNRQLA